MIHRIVQFALRQRFLILMLVVFLAIGGAVSFQHMPVDAYPDLSPPMVEIITQWPGHAAEEVERLVTLPTEVEMNGVPKMDVMRSISLYGLSDVILTFDEDTDDYFARQLVFQRLSEVTYPVRRDAHALRRSPALRVSSIATCSKARTARPGTENLRRLGDRARIQAGARRGGRFRIRRHGDAVSSAARSGAALRLSHHRAAGDPAAFGKQCQRRRRLLFARRPVLLRARHRLAARRSGHRRRGCRRRRMACPCAFATWAK